MNLEHQIELCSHHYQKWKGMALSAGSIEESRKCMDKAFFWLELQTAFITLFALEKTTDTPEARIKIIEAKAKISRKLADYAKDIFNEFNS
jgi:hypothetical protein